MMVLSGIVTSISIPIFFMGFILIILITLFVSIIPFGFPQETIPDTSSMPYYCQGDYNYPFNGKTIKADGCGITSMAMVASLLTQSTITPEQTAALANQNAAFNTVKTHTAILALANNYNLGPVEQMGGPTKNCCGNQKYNQDYIQEKLKQNCPIIASVSGGYFNPSGKGHYIAIYGMGAKGATVYDPGSRIKYNLSLKSGGTPLNLIFSNAKHIWIFQPAAQLTIAGGSNAEILFNLLKQNGYSDAAAAGIIGNAYQECAHGKTDLNPASSSGGFNPSVGIIQWNGTRRFRLLIQAAGMHKAWTEMDVQASFLVSELNGNGQWVWTKYAQKHYASEAHMSGIEFKTCSDPSIAAEAFCANFVRPNFEKSNLSYRKKMAKEIMNLYGGKTK